MSTLQFPANPAIGDTYEWDAYKYVWDGEKWKTVGIGYNPVNDLRDELEPRISNNESKVFEALRRSYSEAGYNLVGGSFEAGGTLVNANDVLLQERTGKAFSGPAGPVAAGTDPASGGVGASAWSEVPVGYTPVVNVTDFGAIPNSEVDLAPILRRLCVSNRTVIIPPGTYKMKTSLGPVPGVASSPCVALDGVSNLKIRGEGRVRLEIDGAQLTANHNFFTYYVSAASAAIGNYSVNNSVENIEFVFKRDPGLVGNTSGINATSSENFLVENCTFDATASYPVLAVPGTGGIGNVYRNNTFKGVATCFDNSEMYLSTWDNNKCYFLTGLGVTAFNHFYDTVTIANIRLSMPKPMTLAGGNTYRDNKIIGYGSPFAIRGMKNFLIRGNTATNTSMNSATAYSAIRIATETAELAISEQVRNVLISDNIISGFLNSGSGTSRGIFVDRSVGAIDGVTITNNIINNCEVGISELGTGVASEVFNNNVDSTTVANPYPLCTLLARSGSQPGFPPRLQSIGADLALEPAAGFMVRFNTQAAQVVGAEIIKRYIEVKDQSGIVRKLAIIE